MTPLLLRVLAVISFFVSLAPGAWADDKTNAASVNAPASATTVVAPDDVQKAMAIPPGPARNAALSAAVATWAKTNPADAMNYGLPVSDRSTQRTVIETASHVWVDADEKTAVDWAMHRGAAIQRHFIFGAFGGKEKQAAAEWLLQQPQHDGGEFSVLMEAWCGHGKDNQKTTADAAAWLLKQKQLSKEDANGALFFVAGAMTWNDPDAAAAWVSNLPPNFSISAAAQSVVNIWSRKTPADIPKIRDWIQKLSIPDADKAALNKAIVIK